MFNSLFGIYFFFSSRRRHTRYWRDWSSDVCSSDLVWSRWGMESANPRVPGPMRWLTLDGEFRVRLVDERPSSVTVLVGDLPVAVRPLHEIQATEAFVRRALARLLGRAAPPGG